MKKILIVFFGMIPFLSLFIESSFSFEESIMSKDGISVSEQVIYSSEYTQTYLFPAPLGIDAAFGWTFPGGTGENVKIIDIEKGIFEKHEDLPQAFWTSSNSSPSDHATAVAGILVAKNDSKGIVGIVHNSKLGSQSLSTGSWSSDIKNAGKQLEAGDVFIIEEQRWGPNLSYAPLEFYNEVFNSVKELTDRGVLCVAAAGNGGSDLDDPVFEGAFNLEHRDSGCILVGAAGNTELSRHKKMFFSNYGSRIDAFGYGENILTTGYGDLVAANGSKYTSIFAGTSSATPIVAGVVAMLSSIAKAQGRILTPKEIREALRNTGTPQKGDLSQRIGTLPNLPELIQYLKLAQ